MIKLKSNRQEGRLSILVDSEALSGRGRAIFLKAADVVSAADVNVMATFGRGIVSAAMRPERAYALRLQPMGGGAQDRSASFYMTSVEAAACTETGISAAERALTLNILGLSTTKPEDLVTPGHILPAVVSADVPESLELVSLALDYEMRQSASVVVAWCDILDKKGDVANSAYAVKLAASLDCPLLIRMSTAVVEAKSLAASKGLPYLEVMDGGLDLGQFA